MNDPKSCQNRSLLNSFGAYQAYYPTAFLSNKSSSAISWIGTIQAFLLEIIGVTIDPIFDRGYFHTLVYTAAFLVVFGIVMLSLCSAYWLVVLMQGVCGLRTEKSVRLRWALLRRLRI